MCTLTHSSKSKLTYSTLSTSEQQCKLVSVCRSLPEDMAGIFHKSIEATAICLYTRRIKR